KNLATDARGKKKTAHLLIPNVRFTKLIIHHLRTKHNIYPRTSSPLHYSHDESILNTLIFVRKDGREIFGMPIPDALLTDEIKEAPYYGDYQEHVAKYQQFVDGERGKAVKEGATESSEATKVTKPKAGKATKPSGDKAPNPTNTQPPIPKPAPTQPSKVVSKKKHKLVKETPNEPSLAKRSKGGLTLIEIKAAKPKAVTTTATTTTTVVTRPKAKGIAQEQEELTVEEKSKLFVELMDKRKKHFARLRVEEQRRKPPTKAQKRNQICTYLKNMAGFTHNSFVSMDSEVVKGGKEKDEDSVTRAEESSSKRAGTELEQEIIKKKKIDDDKKEAEIKKHMEIVVDEEEIAVDAIPLATKPPIININREDLKTLWKLVKAKHGNTRLEKAYERVLWGDLKMMFEPDIESDVWRNLQGHKVIVWKLFSSSGVHFVRFQNLRIFMLLLKLMTKLVKNPGSV
ncbi:hypothetical protein Tco_1126727, partial [Tanacetum coccineum]